MSIPSHVARARGVWKLQRSCRRCQALPRWQTSAPASTPPPPQVDSPTRLALELVKQPLKAPPKMLWVGLTRHWGWSPEHPGLSVSPRPALPASGPALQGYSWGVYTVGGSTLLGWAPLYGRASLGEPGGGIPRRYGPGFLRAIGCLLFLLQVFEQALVSYCAALAVRRHTSHFLYRDSERDLLIISGDI